MEINPQSTLKRDAKKHGCRKCKRKFSTQVSFDAPETPEDGPEFSSLAMHILEKKFLDSPERDPAQVLPFLHLGSLVSSKVSIYG